MTPAAICVYPPGTFVDTPGDIPECYLTKTIMYIGRLLYFNERQVRIDRSGYINRVG